MVLWCLLVIASAVAVGQELHANSAISEHADPLLDPSTSFVEEARPLKSWKHPAPELTNTSTSDSKKKVTSEPKSVRNSTTSNDSQTSKAYTITPSEFAKKTADTLKDGNAKVVKADDPPAKGSRGEELVLKEVEESTTLKNNEFTKPSSEGLTAVYPDSTTSSDLANKSQQHFNSNTADRTPVINSQDLLPDTKVLDKESVSSNSGNKSSTSDVEIGSKMDISLTNKRSFLVSKTHNFLNAKDSLDDSETPNFFYLANKISDEITAYSNDVVVLWDKKKVELSQSTEATSVLKDYMDKISISQAANNTECVKKDLENHAARVKTLQEIILSCEAGLKRKDWHELQNKTRDTLNKINIIVHEATNSLSNLSKEKEDYDRNKTAIENNAKKKLNELDAESINKIFSQLKMNSLKSDEEDYVKCINDKTQKGLVVDTMNDIMRIKNNCVG